MKDKNKIYAEDVSAVITSFNQGGMIADAVRSLLQQTVLPYEIIIVDDGSTDEESLSVLKKIEKDSGPEIPVNVYYRKNGGVSSARNTGIRKTRAGMVLVLDGDDTLEPEYIEQVRGLLLENPDMVAASSWMHTFGVLDAAVCPSGGSLAEFLPRNCCPATHILKKEAFEKCGGYDETMRSGFEDWEFFLSLLETRPSACIGTVKIPLINYRTAPASSNVKSMNKRQELMRFIIEKHKNSYQAHMTEVILGLEAISDARLYGWETEIICSLEQNQRLSESSYKFIQNPTYGDGGMASAVRIISSRK